uniref:Hipothetical protein n=1 Tax=Ixodes ricinus TaxID=34613 RepID=A0A0K8R6X3_IXORI
MVWGVLHHSGACIRAKWRNSTPTSKVRGGFGVISPELELAGQDAPVGYPMQMEYIIKIKKKIAKCLVI